MLFDFLGLPSPLEEQAAEFLERAKQNAQWCQDSIIVFLDFHKQRVGRKELATGTLKNYYRAAKLFCEMNDLTAINWKRISKELPRANNYSSSDRAPILEEICNLVEYPDRRIKPIYPPTALVVIAVITGLVLYFLPFRRISNRSRNSI